MAHLDEIVEKEAVPRGWPANLAMRYMTEYLKYDVGPRQLEAIRLFHQLAEKHGIIDGPLQELKVVPDARTVCGQCVPLPLELRKASLRDSR